MDYVDLTAFGVGHKEEHDIKIDGMSLKKIEELLNHNRDEVKLVRRLKSLEGLLD
jgi:hypothetical protein